MKYRTKLYVALAGTALVSSLSGLTVLYFEFRHQAYKSEQSRAITVAATAAALLDPDLSKPVNTPADEETAAYKAAKEVLKKARDANRRQDLYISFLYTLKPDPNNPDKIIYSIDAEESPKDISHPGDPMDAYGSGLINHLHEYYSPPDFVVDPWGIWVSGFAPVHDKQGNYVATVGADISMENYLYDLRRLIWYFSPAILVSLGFAFIGGHMLARRVTMALGNLLDCVREIAGGNLQSRSTLQTKDEFEELGLEINRMAKGLEERERLKLNFARYVSHHVLERILTAESAAKLEGERRKITVLFSDIRRFTELAETLPPEQLVAFLNEYLGTMLEVIFHFQGTLDKFLGDGIMVEFGAPLDDELQENHAVMAALVMQEELARLNAKWERENKPVIKIGIGIHTGLAVVGNIGSEKRIEYTAVGDTVNVAARLQNATKLLQKSILISETTYKGLDEGQFKAESLGPMILPGRKETITVYAIEGKTALIGKREITSI